MPKVLIAGGHPLVRSAIKALLVSIGGVSMAGECARDTQAIGSAVHRLRPDVVVLDCDLGSSGSIDTVIEWVHAAKGAAVLLLTAQENRRVLAAALQHGALGVVSKDRSPDVLVRAIRAVAAGETWLEHSIVVNMFRDEQREDVERAMPVSHEKLTRREAQIVHLVSLGLQNKKIAERLCISETTVRHHLTSIYGKMGVSNRLELMRFTYSEGMAAAS